MKSMRILRIVKMTNKEYLNKLQEYQTSDAPVEVRQKDIDALNKEYNQDGGAITKALKDFEESAPYLKDL